MNNNPKSNTLQLTTGAMIIAIFTVLLLLNRQTGGLFEEFFIYLLPIPMVIYSTEFGWKRGLMVFVGMAAFSFIFGTPTSIFYAITAALLGLIFGTMLNKQIDTMRIMFVVMGLSAVFTLVSTVALASVFGYNLDLEVSEMQNMMNVMAERVNTADQTILDPSLFSVNFLKQMFIFSMVLMGLVEGFIIYRLSIAILKKLRYPVRPAAPIYSIYPPKVTGFAAFAAYLFGASAFANPSDNVMRQNIIQALWIAGYLYLLVFGVIALSLLIRKYLTHKQIYVVLLTMAGTLFLSQLTPFLGTAYVSLGLHEYLLRPRQDNTSLRRY